jgi:hypothetical protein
MLLVLLHPATMCAVRSLLEAGRHQRRWQGLNNAFDPNISCNHVIAQHEVHIVAVDISSGSV